MKPYYDAFLGILSDGDLLSLSSAKFASPLGLNVLGTKIKQTYPDMFVRIYNLEITDKHIVTQDIFQVINQHEKILVAFTLIAGNTFKTITLAKKLKEKGCDVIIGGPDINFANADYFASLPMIDSVCVGFGEQIILDIIEKGIFQKIFITEPCFDFQNTTVDYSLLFDLENYGGVSMLWGGDCHLCRKRCYFCSRQKRGFGWRDPKLVWQELQLPFSVGINKIYNTADTVAVNLQELQLLANTKPDNLQSMQMKCFINASQVNETATKLLKKLNAWAAIGIESLSRISSVGKGTTKTEDNYQAIEMLAQNEIPMILTFIIGLPGETKETLQKDAEEIIKIVSKYKEYIYWITISPLLITLGSQAFADCCQKLNGKPLPTKNFTEFYNPLLLTEFYFRNFCSVSLEEVYQKINQLKLMIHDLAPVIIFDSKGLDPELWNAV